MANDPEGENSTSRSPDAMKTYRFIGMLMVFLVIASVVFVFVKTLVFNATISERALQQSLIAASVGVSVVCLIAWMLDLLKVVDLRAGLAKLLWTVLIASILSSSALIYKRFAVEQTKVAIACLRPLISFSMDRPPSLRLNKNYQRGEPIVFFVSLRNLQESENGDFSLTLRYELEDRTRRRSVFIQHHFSGNAEKINGDPSRQKMRQAYLTIAPECVGRDILRISEDISFMDYDFQPGAYYLRVTAFDEVNSSFAIENMDVLLTQ